MEPTIFVADDDAAVSRALVSAGNLLGCPVCAFASAAEFLAAYEPSMPGCLVLDIKMPGMTGLELQSKLIADGVRLPVVMISGHADVRIAVEVMSRGAVTLLEKPFRLDELIAKVREALAIDAARREEDSLRSEVNTKLGSLTEKEGEVMRLIAAGMTNKEIAAELDLSVRAVEDRRTRVMKRTGAKSLAELLQLWARRGGG